MSDLEEQVLPSESVALPVKQLRYQLKTGSNFKLGACH